MSRAVGPHPRSEPGSRAGTESPAAQGIRIGAGAIRAVGRRHNLWFLVVVDGSRVGPPHLAQDLLEALRFRGDRRLLLMRHRHWYLAHILRHGLLLLLGGSLYRLMPRRPDILKVIGIIIMLIRPTIVPIVLYYI